MDHDCYQVKELFKRLANSLIDRYPNINFSFNKQDKEIVEDWLRECEVDEELKAGLHARYR